MTTPPLSRILYVEDESDIQAVAQLALENVGEFSVALCSSGGEALEKAPIFDPHLILLDVMMPGMDGLSTLEALRQIPQLSSTPVIFMTAKVQPHEVSMYKERGAVDVIFKFVLPEPLPQAPAGSLPGAGPGSEPPEASGSQSRAPARADGRRAENRKGGKIGRNAPCTCGSGRKYKKCCGAL